MVIMYYSLPFIVGIAFFVAIVIKARMNTYDINRGIGEIRLTEKYLDFIRDMSKFKEIYPEFSSEKLEKEVSRVYIEFEKAWQNKNLEPVRPYFSDIVYERLDRQLEHYRKSHETNILKNISVLKVRLKGWKQDNGKDIIVVNLCAKMNNYVIKDKTKRVVKDSTTTVKTIEYEWFLERTTGAPTTESGTYKKECSNCGAKIDINKTTECPYCHYVVTTDEFGWLVGAINFVSQKREK